MPPLFFRPPNSIASLAAHFAFLGAALPPIVASCRMSPSTVPANNPFIPKGTEIRITKCVVRSNLNVTACIRLQCNPMPPAACPSGQGANSGAACSWNLGPDCTSVLPISPRNVWSFGWMSTDPTPVGVAAFGKGYTTLPSGEACTTLSRHAHVLGSPRGLCCLPFVTWARLHFCAVPSCLGDRQLQKPRFLSLVCSCRSVHVPSKHPSLEVYPGLHSTSIPAC